MIARQRSGDMANGAPFAHEDSAGHFVASEKVQARFGQYGTIGENIMMERDPARAFDAEAFARRAVQGWMNSEGHRANILSPAYDRSGVGVASLVRVEYGYVLGPRSQAQIAVEGVGQWTGCVDDTGRLEPDTGDAIVRRQWWPHAGATLSVGVTWR